MWHMSYRMYRFRIFIPYIAYGVEYIMFVYMYVTSKRTCNGLISYYTNWFALIKESLKDLKENLYKLYENK